MDKISRKLLSTPYMLSCEGCPILRQICAWHCIVLCSHYRTEQKHYNNERSKTMRNLTKLNLSEN